MSRQYSRTNRLEPVGEEWKSRVVLVGGEWQGENYVRYPEPRLVVRWFKVVIMENVTKSAKRSLQDAFDAAKLEELMDNYKRTKAEFDRAKAEIDEFFREDVTEFSKMEM